MFFKIKRIVHYVGILKSLYYDAQSEKHKKKHLRLKHRVVV